MLYERFFIKDGNMHIPCYFCREAIFVENDGKLEPTDPMIYYVECEGILHGHHTRCYIAYKEKIQQNTPE